MNAFGKQVLEGSVYVEFDVSVNSVKAAVVVVVVALAVVVVAEVVVAAVVIVEEVVLVNKSTVSSSFNEQPEAIAAASVTANTLNSLFFMSFRLALIPFYYIRRIAIYAELQFVNMAVGKICQTCKNTPSQNS